MFLNPVTPRGCLRKVAEKCIRNFLAQKAVLLFGYKRVRM